MLKRVLVSAILIISLPIMPAVAQVTDRQQTAASPSRNSPQQMFLIWNGSAKARKTVLTDIVNWLAANFDLPAIYDHPDIQFASSEDLFGMRYNSYFKKDNSTNGKSDPKVAIVAIYSDAMKIIFLNDGWTGKTPAEQSALVHEMVHHLQNVGGLKYECRDAREKIAYQAQNRWLEAFDRDLQTEFEIDPFTLLVRSTCQY